MARRLGNVLLGTVVLTNLIVFGLFAGTEPASARMFEDCDSECCQCMRPGPGYPWICASIPFGCEEIECWDDRGCN